jgi:hypothetical protein
MKRKRPTLDDPIEALGLNTRTRRILFCEGIDTIGKLLERSRADLLRLPDFGLKSLRGLEAVLAEYGWELDPWTPTFSTKELIWAARKLAHVSDTKADQLFRDNAAARELFDRVRAYCAKFIQMH